MSHETAKTLWNIHKVFAVFLCRNIENWRYRGLSIVKHIKNRGAGNEKRYIGIWGNAKNYS